MSTFRTTRPLTPALVGVALCHVACGPFPRANNAHPYRRPFHPYSNTAISRETSLTLSRSNFNRVERYHSEHGPPCEGATRAHDKRRDDPRTILDSLCALPFSLRPIHRLVDLTSNQPMRSMTLALPPHHQFCSTVSRQHSRILMVLHFI